MEQAKGRHSTSSHGHRHMHLLLCAHTHTNMYILIYTQKEVKYVFSILLLRDSHSFLWNIFIPPESWKHTDWNKKSTSRAEAITILGQPWNVSKPSRNPKDCWCSSTQHGSYQWHLYTQRRWRITWKVRKKDLLFLRNPAFIYFLFLFFYFSFIENEFFYTRYFD